MRSILLHIYDDDCLDARMQVALDLARAFDGHLTCIQAMPFELGVPGDIYGTIAAELLPDIRKQADMLRERLTHRLAAEDVTWSWIHEDGLAREQLLRRAGLSDIVVLGSCEPFRTKGPSALVGDIVLRSRTPVLVVPPDAKQFDCDGPAIVAWDGSSEASRALRGAAPLLAKARSVTLVTVTGESDGKALDLPPTEGAEYLSRHGIACEMTDLPSGGGTVAEGLTGAATVRKAAYIIMGAYGHSRLTETIWGGVTRTLFSNPPLPILACH